MMDYTNDISIGSVHKGSFSISKTLLLAPPCDNNTSKRYNNIVKEALFEFLNQSKKNYLIYHPDFTVPSIKLHSLVPMCLTYAATFTIWSYI